MNCCIVRQGRCNELDRVCGGVELSWPRQILGVHYVGITLQRMVRMAAWLIAGVGIVYLIVAVDLLVRGNWGLGIAFLGYCLGNVGLYLEAK